MVEAGLILEGGGLRGVYTAGVLDAFLEEQIQFSSIYGVSAGCCHACSYMSGQKGRAYRISVDYLDDPRYLSVRSLLRTGDIFGVEMAYSKIPNELDPFDYDAFENYPGTLYAVVTEVNTGRALYIPVRDARRQLWAVRASSSLPLVSRTIVVNGHPLLDGGVADSIPIRKSIRDGNRKNVVILTREEGYHKTYNTNMPLLRLRYRYKTEFLEQNEDRHVRYNSTLAFLEKEKEAGNIFVIRPKEKVEVKSLEKDKEKLKKLYQSGLADGREAIDSMRTYLDA